MNRLTHLFVALAVFGIAQAEPQPNIIFILADDLGWSDTSLYGTTDFYRTPNIQRLAKRGITFTRAYSASPLCSPTRASILTGQSPARHGITTPGCHLQAEILKARQGTSAAANQKAIFPVSATRLGTEHYTLAEALKDSGYITGHFGKWHLGRDPYSPLEHGFDVDIPHWPGPGPAGSYVAPWKFDNFDPDPQTPNEHIEDRMAKEAVQFMKKNQDRPFFLNYWMFSVHAPFDAKRDLIEQYRKRVNPKDEQRCPTYAAMIESMDDAVGTLLETVDELGIADHTVIVFASDNGGNMYNMVEGERPTSNRPLRGGKATMYEGGIRGPCIVVCPGLAEPGKRSDAIIQSCDFYPTLLEIADVPVRKGLVLDGRNCVDLVQGTDIRQQPIFTYFPHSPRVPEWLPPSIAVHYGDWKLIRIFHGGDEGEHRYKLFRVWPDPSETEELSAQHPDMVEKLDAMIDEHLRRTSAILPIPNPKFDPAQYKPELEGQQLPARTKSSKRAGTQVAGWSMDNNIRAKVVGGNLEVTATGGDPYMSFRFPKPIKGDSLTFEAKITAASSANVHFFWEQPGVRPRFQRDRSKTFDVFADSDEYRIRFSPSRPISGVRIDPGIGRGKFTFESMRLLREDGSEIYKWNHGPKQAPPRG